MKQWIRSGGAFLLTLGVFLSPLSADCKTERQTRLQRAVGAIYTNPKLAEQELKQLKGPTAKAYLAFIYKSKKVIIPHAGERVDSLMRSALAELPPNTPMMNVERTGNIHYPTIESLLMTLRFIVEEELQVNTPTKIFEEYPQACLNAFAAVYYSSAERADAFAPKNSDDIFNIPQVKSIANTLGKMYGNPVWSGTIACGYARVRRIKALEADFAPQVYLKEWGKAETKANFQATSDYLRMWANSEVWNQQTYIRLQRECDAAKAPLTAHYRKRFHVGERTAAKYADAVLKCYTLIFLDNFSHSTAKEAENMPIYKVFSTPNLTLEKAKEKIGLRVMTKPELSQALRLAILTDGSIELIDWLIKQGAPLEGGPESALFSAVKRPDVVALLITSGADVNETNPIGKTALIQAAQYGALETVKKLLAAGAELNHQMIDSKGELPEAVKTNENFNYESGLRNALMYAAAFGDASTVEYLLSKGADKTTKDAAGWNAAKFLQWNKALSKTERQRLSRLLG